MMLKIVVHNYMPKLTRDAKTESYGGFILQESRFDGRINIMKNGTKVPVLPVL